MTKEIPISEFYCHTDGDSNDVCPYWSLRDDLPKNENGYCSFLGKSDWDLNEEQGTVKVTNKNHKSVTQENTHIFHVSMLFEKLRGCE